MCLAYIRYGYFVHMQSINIAFAEAEMVFVCRKLYSYDLAKEGFLTNDGIPEQFFAKDPYHRAYICEIAAVYVRD